MTALLLSLALAAVALFAAFASRPLPRIKRRLTGAAATRPTPVRLTTPPTAGMAAQAGGWGVGSVCTAPRTSATGRSGFAFDTAAECISANGRR
jgi:hypothetical protein